MIRRTIAALGTLVLVTACTNDDPSAGASRSTVVSVVSVESSVPGPAPTPSAATPVPGTTAPPTDPSVRSTPTTDGSGGVRADEPRGRSLGPLSSTDVEITTDRGDVQIGQGTVPAIARELPVPDGLEITLASSTERSAGYSGTAPSSVGDTASFYRRELDAAGFVIDEDDDLGTSVIIAFHSETAEGRIAIAPAPGDAGTSVVVAYDVNRRD